MGKIKSLDEKFWDKVIKSDKCWLWCGSSLPHGYGRISFQKSRGNRKWIGAHRFSYELHKGLIPNGLVLDHLCRNVWCVNPDHLEAVTERENILRGIGKSAENYKKTHCKNGHEFNEKNTILRNDGSDHKHRTCRECKNKRLRELRKRFKIKNGIPYWHVHP